MSVAKYIVNKHLNIVTKEKTLGVDIQRIDVDNLKEFGEAMPIQTIEPEVIDIISGEEIRSAKISDARIDKGVLQRFRKIDFVIKNTLDSEIYVFFRHYGSSSSSDVGEGNISVALDDGSIEDYGQGSASVNHKIPGKTTNIVLSTVIPTDGEGNLTRVRAPFQEIYNFNSLDIGYRTIDTPTEGSLSITMIGEPY